MFQREIAQKSPEIDSPVSRLVTPTTVRALISPQSHRASASLRPCAGHSVKTTPRVRLRHDDSQIQFAAIESSPLGLENRDSQMLTDRQREVKERQGLEAAMFPEIKSSPAAVTKASALHIPQLAFKPNQAPSVGINADDEISPTLPPNAMMNGFLGSSPTPSSGRHKSQNIFSDDGPPSSPPFISSHLHIDRKSPIVSQNGRRSPMEVVSGSQQLECATFPSQQEEGPSAVAKEPCADKKDDQQRSVSDTNITSDLDVYVDAASEPPPSHLSDLPSLKERSLRQHEDGDRSWINSCQSREQSLELHRQSSHELEIGKVTESFQSEASSRFLTDDDQAAAQLLAELEGAQSPYLLRSRGQAQTSKKRKRSPIHVSRKRARTSAVSEDSLAISEIPNAGEVVADCVLVDARPATGDFRPISPETVVKRERSESPPSAAFASTVRETPLPARRYSGRARSSAVSQRSSQGSSTTRRSGRKVQIKPETEDAATSPNAVPKTGKRKSMRLNRANSLHMDTSSDPVHVDDGSLQPSMSFSVIDVPRPCADHTANMESTSINRPDPSQHQTSVPSLQVHDMPDKGAERQPSPQTILEGFKSMYDQIKEVTLGAEEERAMIQILFESVQEVHEAGRRHAKA